MNERIKELALQAGYEKDMFGIGHWDMPECKKFAELIVGECADIAGKYGTPDGYYISAEINRIMLNIRTDKGFGVEEMINNSDNNN